MKKKMPNANLSKQLGQQLAKEASALSDAAIKSIDPTVVAKAVAASDQGVQQLMLARLVAGERLVEVFALQNTTQPELQVFFRFEPAKEIIHLADSGVLAFVDSVKGEVVGTIDPFVLQPERRVGRPFVTVAALQASQSAFALSEKAIEPLVHRERTFFRSVGLGQLGWGLTTDTVCDTSTTSTTWSGTPYRPDKTDPETTGDYCDSAGPIIA